MALSGDAVELPDDDGHPWHSGAQRRAHHLRSRAHDPLALLIGSHHETGLVGEIDHRQVEGVAKLEETDDLGTCGHIHGAPETFRIVEHDAHGIAVDPRESDDARASVMWRDLEKGTLVEYGIEDRMGIVNPALLARDQVQQGLVPSVRIVARLDPRRQPPDVVRKVGKEPLEHVEGLFLGLGKVVDDTAFVDLAALVSKILLGDVDSERSLDDRRTAGEHLARALDHDVEMGEAGVDGRQPRNGTQHRRNHGDATEQVLHARRRGVGRDIRATDLLECPDTASGRIEQPDERQAPVQRHPLRMAALVAYRRV